MKVRKATPEDIKHIVDFQIKMAYETEGITLNEHVIHSGVKRVFQNKLLGFYLVVECDESIAGCMLLTPEWSDWRNSTWLWIQSLFVNPEYRKKGAFSALYGYVKDLVIKSDQYAGIKLYVDQQNLSAQEVYHKVGMQLSHYRLFEWNKSKF